MSSQSIHNFLRYLSLKNYMSWIQKIHIVIRITSKIQPFHPFTSSDISRKFHQNPSISFSATLYTNTSGSLDPDDPYSDPDHSQNLITCSLHHLGHFLKISSKCTHKFLSYLSLKKLNFMDPEDPDSDLDHSQNLTISSFYHFGHILKILSESICQFLSYLVHKQTNRGPKMTLGQVLWRSVDDLK